MKARVWSLVALGAGSICVGAASGCSSSSSNGSAGSEAGAGASSASSSGGPSSGDGSSNLGGGLTQTFACTSAAVCDGGICCASTATMTATCAVGACPSGDIQLCVSQIECLGGADLCEMGSLKGVMVGVCEESDAGSEGGAGGVDSGSPDAAATDAGLDGSAGDAPSDAPGG